MLRMIKDMSEIIRLSLQKEYLYAEMIETERRMQIEKLETRGLPADDMAAPHQHVCSALHRENAIIESSFREGL